MSLLKFVNLFFFQWFCVRLTKHTEERVENYRLHSFDMMPDGTFSSRGYGHKHTYQWYSIQYWVVPTTGWSKPFKYMNGVAEYVRVTKEKRIS